MQSFDVVIVGGGMVGLALACGLHDSRLRIAVLEINQPEINSPAGLPSLRVSAINSASERLLSQLKVWDDISQTRACAYNAMEVWERDSFARIDFCAKECGFEHLGHIVENDIIQHALWRRAALLPDITLFAPVQLQHIAFGENEAFISLDNGRMLTARLVVGADGANSWLRQQADIPVTFWDYQHSALVATIRCAKAHQYTARQTFHNEGILAFLPLSEPDLCSIVWSVAPLEAQRLQALPAERFNHELAAIFDGCLGACKLESERQIHPLMGRYARSFAAHRLALVGDAAHTIHPLAGQGANLGFMDVAELISEIKRLQHQGKDFGRHYYLGSYERRRKLDAALMLAGMQGLRELFAGGHPAKKLLRGIGLSFVQSFPAIKPKLIRQAMGLNHLPQWLS